MTVRVGRSVTTTKTLLANVNRTRGIAAANVVVAYRQGDSDGLVIAQYYQSQRGIPVANVIALPMAWQPSDGLLVTSADADAVITALSPRFLQGDVLAIVTCGNMPVVINDGTHQVVFFSHLLGWPLYYAAQPTATRYSTWTAPDAPGGALYADHNTTYGAFTSYAIPYTQGANQYNNRTRVIGYVPPKSVSPSTWCAPHFRLETSPVATGDARITNASQVNYCKRMIDDCLTAEAARYRDFGTAVLSSSGSYPAEAGGIYANGGTELVVGYAAYSEIAYSGVAGTIYVEHVDANGAEPPSIVRNMAYGNYAFDGCLFRDPVSNGVFQLANIPGGTTAGVAPTFDTSRPGAVTVDGTCNWTFKASRPADSRPAGATTLEPNYGTFVAITDVLFRACGYRSYYGGAVQPEQQADFTYRKGAVCVFSQSFSAAPVPVAGLDWDYGSPQFLTTTGNNSTAQACYVDGTVGASCTLLNANGQTLVPFAILAPTGVGATRQFTGTNTLVLTQTTPAASATVNLTGSLRNMVAQINAAITANGLTNWSVATGTSAATSYALGPESRCMTALKNGAALVVGTHAGGGIGDPGTSGAGKPGKLFANLLMGLSAGEAAYTLLSYMSWNNYALYGDPLYRPFWHLKAW